MKSIHNFLIGVALAALAALPFADQAQAGYNTPVPCAAMPALTGAITSSAGSCTTTLSGSFTNVTASGYFATTGGTLPTQAAGTLGIGGENTAPTLGANGEGDIYLGSTTLGLVSIGKGSTNDLTWLNSGGSTVCDVPTGTTYLTCGGSGFSGAIGGTGPAPGAFTTLSASGTVSGSGFSNYLASPPAIGTTAPAAGEFTTLEATGILTTQSGEIVQSRVVTASGAVTVATTDFIVVVDKTSGAATTVNLPSSPPTGVVYIIKDGKGDAAANNITVTPASGNIDGAGTLVMNVGYEAVNLLYNGTQYNAF